MTDKSDLVFIEHILESINAIGGFSENLNREELSLNRLKQSAIVREIEIIGEAVKNISDNLKNTHKKIEWREIAGTRDKMIHHYFGVDLDIVWNIIKVNLPELKAKIVNIKREITDKE
ncbi:DUF86 domain-containing protein [Candidatus Pacearchaeota archaeon]|nr:DUF86 domain-containing protein [Candidatus Pacearchaeota archaeon]